MVGSITPIFQTQIISSVEPHRVGIANSLFFNSMDAGMAIGAYILGLIASGFGYRTVFFAGGILIIVGGLLYFILNKKKENRETKENREAVLINH